MDESGEGGGKRQFVGVNRTRHRGIGRRYSVAGEEKEVKEKEEEVVEVVPVR